MHCPPPSPTSPQKYERENIADALVSQAFAKGQQVVKQVGPSSLSSVISQGAAPWLHSTAPHCTMGRCQMPP